MFLNAIKESQAKYVNRIFDHTDNSLPVKFIRYCIRFHPLLNARYHFATGNIRLANELIKKHDLKKRINRQLIDIIENIDQIVKQGHYKISEKAFKDIIPWNNNVLFALDKSLPYDSPGYSIRSHMILKHLKQSGPNVIAATRLDYPWIVPAHSSKLFCSEDTVESIKYLRLKSRYNHWDNNLLGLNYINEYADKLAKVAKNHNAAVLHSASNYITGLAGAKAARIAGCKSIYEMRGLWHLSRKVLEPNFAYSDEYQYNEIMELSAANESDAVVTLSGAMKSWLTAKGIPENKITVIPNAVDISHFSILQKDEELKLSLGLKGKTIVGFIGTLTAYEGLDLLVKSVAALANSGMDISLLIIGRGYAEKSLNELAASLPGGKNIHFTGFIPFQNIKKYYSIIDIFPYPRNNLEVCRIVPPLKPLESMAMAKAVVVSDLSPLLEMVEDGYNGYVCRADNSESLTKVLKKLYENPNHRNEIGTNARQWVVKERSWKNIIKKYEQLYQTICNT